ncbi:MAG: IS1595 family transposase [Bacteroidales bacterium]|nr:IS1595 family transposase [Bacteroidales bacterium]
MKNITIKCYDSLKDLTDYFCNQRTCCEYLAMKRWGGKPRCPYCGCETVYRRKDGRYACGDCSKSFSVLVGTIFQNTKLPLLTWFKAIYLVCNTRQGISSCQLSLLLGVTQKTAWYLLHKIRILLKDKNDDYQDIVSGSIEWRLSRKGRLFQMRVAKCPHQMHPEVLKFVKPGSRIVYDEIICYQSLSESELSIYNVEDPYPLGFKKGTNDSRRVVDAFWSQLKRMVMGIHHFISASHFHRYIYEALFRRVTRLMSAGRRFELFFEKIEQVVPYKLVSP